MGVFVDVVIHVATHLSSCTLFCQVTIRQGKMILAAGSGVVESAVQPPKPGMARFTTSGIKVHPQIM